jgi:hypothetical protein
MPRAASKPKTAPKKTIKKATKPKVSKPKVAKKATKPKAKKSPAKAPLQRNTTLAQKVKGGTGKLRAVSRTKK